MSEPAICEEGGKGLLLPFIPGEQEWPRSVRAIMYLGVLSWFFLGVAIIADIFMAAIEAVTSKRKLVTLKSGQRIPVKVWNPTVANLTLMALGSSAPEIMLSVIELFGSNFYSGELGPSTIVGSAAFNLMVIIAVCVYVIPDSEFRTIKQIKVFFVTGTCSVFAYVWLAFILALHTPDLVDLWEGLLTFFFFPILVVISYMADVEMCCFRRKDGSAEKIVGKLAENGHDLTVREVNLIQRVTRVEDKHISLAQRRQEVSAGKATGKQNKEVTVGFSMNTYTVTETVTEIPLEVSTCGGYAEGGHIAIEYATRDGNMEEALGHYCSRRDFIEIPRGARSATLTVERKAGLPEVNSADVSGHDEGRFFWVEILEAAVVRDGVPVQEAMAAKGCAKERVVVDPYHQRAKAIIQPGRSSEGKGVLRFKKTEIQHNPHHEHETIVKVAVERVMGYTGAISCTYRTEPDTGRDNFDFRMDEGTLHFPSGILERTIEIKVVKKPLSENTKQFFVFLEDVDGTEEDDSAFFEQDNAGCTVFLLASSSAEMHATDHIMRALDGWVNFNTVAEGNSGWLEQFNAALKPDMDDGDVASIMDWAVHYVSLPWKLFFALVPPPAYAGGWLCFFFALLMIGGVTAFIGDLASLLGCVMGMPDPITAITIVALGTSLPDTFASKVAAVEDDTADAAIGNVTGSNSVNVFLGLGMPWMIACIYWTVRGPTDEWKRKYPTFAETYPDGGFIVPAGDLVFSVTIFSICAIACLGTIIYRRRSFGAELGGPQGVKVNTSIFFVLLWFLYISVASWKVLSGDVSTGEMALAITGGVFAVVVGMAAISGFVNCTQWRNRAAQQAQKDIIHEAFEHLNKHDSQAKMLAVLGNRDVWHAMGELKTHIDGLNALCSMLEAASERSHRRASLQSTATVASASVPQSLPEAAALAPSPALLAAAPQAPAPAPSLAPLTAAVVLPVVEVAPSEDGDLESGGCGHDDFQAQVATPDVARLGFGIGDQEAGRAGGEVAADEKLTSRALASGPPAYVSSAQSLLDEDTESSIPLVARQRNSEVMSQVSRVAGEASVADGAKKKKGVGSRKAGHSDVKKTTTTARSKAKPKDRETTSNA